MSEKISENIKLKRHRLLSQVRRHQPVERLALARQLRISNSRVCDLVQQLLDDRMLVEESSGTDRRGRRGVPVRLNPDYGHFVGFDIEARWLRLVAVDFAGNLVWKKRQKLKACPTRRNLIDAILSFIDRGLKQIRETFPTLLGIGLASCGVTDIPRGVMLHYNLIEAVKDIPLRDLVASRFELPCVMEDNIRAMTLAEGVDGAGKPYQNFFCLAVRSGMGMGIVLNGKLHTGSHGFAGEIAHWPLPVGRVASRWKRLEQVVSEHALGVGPKGQKLSFDRAKEAGKLLGAQLVSMALLLDPEAIILAGDLLDPGGVLWEQVNRSFCQLNLPELMGRIQILPARCGSYGAALGATYRCFEFLFPTELASVT